MSNKEKEDKFIIKKEKNTNRRIIIRTTDEMADEIFSIAKENGVSVNNLLVSCIRYALDHRWKLFDKSIKILYICYIFIFINSVK